MNKYVGIYGRLMMFSSEMAHVGRPGSSVLEVFGFCESVFILAVVDAVEDVEPAVDGHGHRVELDAIDVSRRCAIDALGGGVLPECTQVGISRVWIVVTVAAGDIGLVQVELSGDQVGPVGLEVGLRGVHHAEVVVAEVYLLQGRLCTHHTDNGYKRLIYRLRACSL